MFISATPYRVSFFGGGTDYPSWYQENGGQVLSATISHYCTIQARILPPFFEHKHRIVWSRIETPSRTEDIAHPAVRAAIQYFKINAGLEIHHIGDLPARSGLGSSSSFAVGILNALDAVLGGDMDKLSLAREAIYLERDLLKENVGIQDQIAVATGGLNHITIPCDGKFNVHPVVLSEDRKQAFQDHLLLIYTGVSRTASTIAQQFLKELPSRKHTLTEMSQMVDEGLSLLTGNTPLNEFGQLLHEGWKMKRSITTGISTALVDEVYDLARANGSVGGKLLGAGGGGFMLFFVAPENRKRLVEALKDFVIVPFEFETLGTHRRSVAGGTFSPS